MRKIFYYELRRMLCHWLFPAMLAANGMYAWYVLTMEIIAGIADTAPFSVWSFCAWMGRVMPAAVITILLLLAGYYGKKQKQAEILLFAAPVTPGKHLAVRCAVLSICFCMLCMVDAAVARVFYSRFFQYYKFSRFILPALLLAVPCFLFSLGLGHLLGRLHQGLTWLLAAMVFLAGALAPEQVWDLFGAGYFASYPLLLPVGRDGEPEFVLQPAWLAARGIYFLLGAGLLGVSARYAGRKRTKA